MYAWSLKGTPVIPNLYQMTRSISAPCLIAMNSAAPNTEPAKYPVRECPVNFITSLITTYQASYARQPPTTLPHDLGGVWFLGWNDFLRFTLKLSTVLSLNENIMFGIRVHWGLP